MGSDSESENELCPKDVPQIDELVFGRLEAHRRSPDHESDSSESAPTESSDHNQPASTLSLHATRGGMDLVDDDFGCIDEYFHTMDESSISAMRARQEHNDYGRYIIFST
jgi:hypothetical protein